MYRETTAAARDPTTYNLQRIASVNRTGNNGMGNMHRDGSLSCPAGVATEGHSIPLTDHAELRFGCSAGR